MFKNEKQIYFISYFSPLACLIFGTGFQRKNTPWTNCHCLNDEGKDLEVSQ